MECIQVKQEDADWRIYHAIPPNTSTSIETLTSACGLAPEIVEESLARLERYCLISRNDTEVRVLSFGEALINNQIQYDKDLPYTIENGVIKARRN
jgi:hypothetical protein